MSSMDVAANIVSALRAEVEGLDKVPASLQQALNDVFDRAETEVRRRAEVDMQASLNDSAETLPLPGYGRAAAQDSYDSFRPPAKQRASRSQGNNRNQQSAGRQNSSDRAFLAERYGIPKPAPQGNQRSQGKPRIGKIASAQNAKPNPILPRVNRHNPTAPPPAVYPADLEKGVANLQNRGFIPQAADVTPAFTHEPAPVTAGNAPLYPHHDQHVRGEIYSSPFGFNASNLKLDLVTPTYPVGAATAPAGGAVDSSAAYGWQAMEQMERDDRRSLTGGAEPAGGAGGGPGGSAAGPSGPEADSESAMYGYPTQDTSGGYGGAGAGGAHGGAGGYGEGGGAGSYGVGGGPTRVGITMSEEEEHGGLGEASLSADGHPNSSYGNTPGGESGGGSNYKIDVSHLIIQNGQLLKTPELTQFLHKHKGRAGVLKDLLEALETCMATYALPLGVVDGMALIRLADKGDGDLCAPTELDLLYCLVNVAQVLEMVNVPGQGYRGNKGAGAAATQIQASWRGTQARGEHRSRMREEFAARTIAGCWRVWWQRKKTVARLVEIRAEEQTKFAARQEKFCGQWHTIRSRARVEVHIASLSRPTGQRRTLSNLAARQNSQMARLCRLSDPLVDVVYVCPFPLSDDVAQYYHKLLGVGGVSEAGSRYRIVYPENFDRLPFGLSLTSLLLYSPRCLKRISNFCRGKDAYIVPGVVGPEDKRLAQMLSLPLMGPDPRVGNALATKSGSKAIFKSAAVNVPISCEAGESVDEVFDKIAGMIVTNLQTPRWILKIDDEFNGRGHAHFDVAYLRTHRKLSKMPGSDQMTEAELQRAKADVSEELRTAISKRVTITNKTVYRNWREYVEALVETGGVIEACPARVSGSPSANVYIQPSGEVSLVCTHDQMFSPPYCFVGASFPQSSVPYPALRGASLAIGAACAKQGIVGYVGIDFVALQSEEGLKLLAVDLNIRYTDTLAAFHMFHFLMGGVYDQGSSGKYYVDKRPGVVLTGLSPEELANPAANNLTSRYYVTSQYVRHPNLSTIQYSNFFNLCRMKGVSFDLQEKRGTAFNLVDSFATGVLGICGVGGSLLECFSTVERGLLFMQKQVGVHKSTFADEQDDDANFKEILAAVKFVVQILGNAAGKKPGSSKGKSKK